MSFPLLHLPDPILLRIFRHLCSPPTPIPPCNLASALPLALCSTRLLHIFRTGCLQVIHAVPRGDELEPVARSDPRFRMRDPHHIRTAVRMGADSVKECYLPVYDCSMENAQWGILEDVAQYCTEIETLSFVDCVRNRITVPAARQREILEMLAKSVKHFSLYIVREAAKLDTLARACEFTPLSLELYHVHPRVHSLILTLLSKRGAQLRDFTLSIETAQPDLQNEFGDFALPFLCSLANTTAKYLPCLENLYIVTGPRATPLTALPGPGVGTEKSRREYDTVCKAVEDVKSGKVQNRVLKRLVLERICTGLGSVIKLFGAQCGEQTEIEVCLHEALLVFPPREGPRIKATKMHSSSWMIKELPKEYFSGVEHIHMGVDEDCGKSRAWAVVDKILPGRVHPDVHSFRFLCNGGKVRTVVAKVPLENADQAREVLRCLSSGFAYARNVRVLSVCGDVLKFVGEDVGSLYSVVGQLRELEELYVEGGREGVVENLAVLLRGLWTCCRGLKVLRIEVGCWGRVRRSHLTTALEAVRELERRLKGVETFNLGRVLQVALKSCDGGKRKRDEDK